MSLSDLQCTDSPHNVTWPNLSTVLRLRNPELELGLIFKHGAMVVTLAAVRTIDQRAA